MGKRHFLTPSFGIVCRRFSQNGDFERKNGKFLYFRRSNLLKKLNPFFFFYQSRLLDGRNWRNGIKVPFPPPKRGADEIDSPSSTGKFY